MNLLHIALLPAVIGATTALIVLYPSMWWHFIVFATALLALVSLIVAAFNIDWEEEDDEDEDDEED